MNPGSLAIVADGLERLRRAKKFGVIRARLLAEARMRCADEMKGASSWRRIAILWRTQREVDEQMEKQFPGSALYLTGGRH
jgi:hypothetical protein